MKIGVMTTFPKLYSTQRLLEEGRRRGHDMHVINTLQCYMDITQVEPMVYYRKKPLTDFDAVIPRISSAITFYGTAVLRQFEMMGVFPLNESNAIGRSRDKLRALQLLSRKGVGLPSTSFAHSTKQTKDLIKLVGGAPCVIKLLEGSQGRGVVLAETQKAAESVIDAFREMSANFLVQQFIKEAGGSDIRCFVVGDKVVASMMRTAKEGEFRSNLHRGGSAKEIRITAAERAMALKAASVMGLNVAGVDIIRASDGPKIIEVNSSPGLEGIENATGKNVAGLIIDFIEKNRGSRKTNVKGRG